MQWMSFSAWLEPLRSVLDDLGDFAPRLVTALLVFVFGLLVTRLAETLARGLCRLLKLDSKLDSVWIFRPWIKGTLSMTPSTTIGTFTFYILLIIVILLTLRVLNPEMNKMILTSMGQILPRMFGFMLIIFLGSLIAMFVSVFAQLVLDRSGVQHPQLWGKVVAWSTFGGAILLSMEQLGIVGKLLTFVVLILFSAIALAGAIAFGLGCKDMARQFLIELLKGDKKD